MSKLVIITSVDDDGKVHVENKFDSSSNVMELMNALEATHAILLDKLNKYSRSEKKRMNVTIDKLLDAKTT